MSVRFDTNTDRLTASANLPTPTAYSICGWAKIRTFRSGGYQPMFWLTNGSGNDQGLRFATDNNFKIVGASEVAFASNPSTSGWFAWAFSCAGTAGTDAKGYWRNNVDTAWTTQTAGGASFTPTVLSIANVDDFVQYTDCEMRYVRMWDAVLTSAELLTESQSATIVRTSNLRRNMALAAAASAGTDTSGNSYSMTASGLVDGASEPTFASTTNQIATEMSTRGVCRGAYRRVA